MTKKEIKKLAFVYGTGTSTEINAKAELMIAEQTKKEQKEISKQDKK